MVSVWVAVAAWLVAWSGLAWLSLDMLKKVRPGETVPMLRLADGSAGWRVAPGLAALFTPVLATALGLVTIGVALTTGGQAPIANVFLALVFVVAHWMHMRMAVKAIESERTGR